jgi:glycosyltransferase involved in cell wall biosynthesis
MKLSIVIPVYNERNTIKEILRRVKQVDLGDLEREIIIVDDNSQDGTRNILAMEEDSITRVIYHPQNRGKGAAVRSGYKAATGDLIVVQDADLEYDPEDFPKLLEPILKGKAQVVYGSRFTGPRKNMLFWHYVGNRFLALTTNVLFNTTLSDMETCYKLMTREVLDSLDLKSDHFDIEPEITAKILKQRIRIFEVPISYAGREMEEGKKITWRDGLPALWTLIKYRFKN